MVYRKSSVFQRVFYDIAENDLVRAIEISVCCLTMRGCECQNRQRLDILPPFTTLWPASITAANINIQKVSVTGYRVVDSAEFFHLETHCAKAPPSDRDWTVWLGV